jgi:hypothetical protein
MLEGGQSVYRNRGVPGVGNAAKRRGSPKGRSTRTRTYPQLQRDFPGLGQPLGVRFLLLPC